MGKIADTILAQGTIKKYIPHVTGFDMTDTLVQIINPERVTVIVPKGFHGFLKDTGVVLLTPQSVLSKKFEGFSTELVLCMHWDSYCGVSRNCFGYGLHMLLEVKGEG